MEENKTITDKTTIRKRIENEPLFTDRGEFFQMLKDYLTDENIFVRAIALNANWGEGKSFFINMLNDELAKDKMSLVFNAWKYDKYNDPIHALIAFINDTEKDHPDYFEEIKNENGIELNKSIALTVPFVTVGVSADKDINGIAKNTLDLTAIYKNIFDQILNKIDFLFIDELDRCNPEFALKIIEVFKHFCIDNPGKTKLVFSFDRIAIGCMIKTRYGDNSLSHQYLQKIIEAEFELPKTDYSIIIFNVMVNHLNINNSVLQDEDHFLTQILIEIIQNYDVSVREVIDLLHLLSNKETFNRLSNKIYKVQFDSESIIYISQCLFLLLIILKNKNYEKYQLLIKNKEINTLTNELDSLKIFRNLIERTINYAYNNGDDAMTLNKVDFDNITYIIFLGCIGIKTEKTDYLYNVINKLKKPFDPSGYGTFELSKKLFNEL